MATRPERIEQLVERSSLGDPEARRARARVSEATARSVLGKINPPASGGFRRGADLPAFAELSGVSEKKKDPSASSEGRERSEHIHRK
jgi:hypothetical protein